MCANWVKCKSHRPELSQAEQRSSEQRAGVVRLEAYIACQEASADFLPVGVEDAAVFVQVTLPLYGDNSNTVNKIQNMSASPYPQTLVLLNDELEFPPPWWFASTSQSGCRKYGHYLPS